MTIQRLVLSSELVIFVWCAKGWRRSSMAWSCFHWDAVSPSHPSSSRSTLMWSFTLINLEIIKNVESHLSGQFETSLFFANYYKHFCILAWSIYSLYNFVCLGQCRFKARSPFKLFDNQLQYVRKTTIALSSDKSNSMVIFTLFKLFNCLFCWWFCWFMISVII